MDVQMELSRILIRELTDGQLIELHEVDGPRSFPIMIGLPEAMAIERRLSGEAPPRPMTHELMDSIMATLGGRLDRVVIHELSEGTFYAVLCIETAEGERLVDARPSDAIALTAAHGVPIFVSESVLDAVQQQDMETDPDGEFGPPDEFAP
ncbi:MAG: bifunctional nuclease family protein [Phycisphaerales bacterium]|nr:bifunctional nuclease family protein [Phycisphaerales bacterium]